MVSQRLLAQDVEHLAYPPRRGATGGTEGATLRIVARLEEEAARILRELADSLPRTNPLWKAADALAAALQLRVSMRDLDARWAERNARPR